MSELENKMKTRGENKVWKDIINEKGEAKNTSSSQVGQAILINEALRLVPLFKNWVERNSGVKDRKQLKEYFNSEEIYEEKILQMLFYLAGSIYLENESKFSKKSVRRHKKISSLQKNIFPEFTFEIVFRITEVIIDFSEYYGVESYVEIKNNKYDRRVRYTCDLSEKIVSEIAHKSIMAFYPTPIEQKPLDWSFEDGVLKGGFHTFQYPLVRANNRDVDYSLYGKEIFDAVNYIQAQPWKINVDVLNEMKKNVKAPIKEDYIKSNFPDIKLCEWDIKLNEEHNLTEERVAELQAHRKTFLEESAIYAGERKDYESALGKYRSVKLAMKIAEEYVGKVFYFPHNYDFRGRIYPLSVGLTPQGSSAVKALLLYAETKPVSKSGMEWNWAYLATLYGDDKLNFHERVKRGIELINTDYKEADEPYEFLSHQLELKRWLRDETYQPNTRIHLDASCSGSQICSSMIGDRSGAEATNVLPMFDENGIQVRQDAYMRVAEKAIENTNSLIELEEDSESKEDLKMFLKQLNENGRKLAKVPTMVSIYSGTINSMKDNVFENLRSFGVERKYITPKKTYKYAKIIYDSIGDTLVGGKMFEQYIQKMSGLIAKGNKSMSWTTIDGFHVYSEKNKLLKPKRIWCMLPNSRRRAPLNKKSYSKDISVPKMKSGSSPNFVHTIDSTLLRMVALKMREEGIVMQDFIHDSFGCHANEVESMLRITKQCFIELMASDIIARLHEELSAQVPLDEKSQDALQKIVPPKLTDFDPTNGGINQVHLSEFFFS